MFKEMRYQKQWRLLYGAASIRQDEVSASPALSHLILTIACENMILLYLFDGTGNGGHTAGTPGIGAVVFWHQS